MGLKLETMCVVLDSGNSEELADFYAKLLGWTKYGKRPDDEWLVVSNSKRDGLPELVFQEVENFERPIWPETPGKHQQMIHLDFHVDDLEEGVQHALSCGAVLSPVQLEPDWRVLFDPAGHPFCILPKRFPD